MENHRLVLLILFFFLFSLLREGQGSKIEVAEHAKHHRGLYGFHPSKLFVFGDSYADTGNNRKTQASSWKIPYGTTFPGKPSGRFSDGRVLTDYLARFLGLKTPVAYRWRKYAKDRLQYGMNFAYGGTGVFDTLILDPNMTTQIDFFQNTVNECVYSQLDLKSSLVLVTLSGNDYGAYLAKGGTTQGLPSFISRVVNQLAVNLNRIGGMGVKNVAVTALQPLGCLPQSTIQNSFQQCNTTDNISVNLHNLLLQQAVAKLNNETVDSPYKIIDLYNSFLTVLENKGHSTGSGFNHGSVAVLAELIEHVAFNHVFVGSFQKRPSSMIISKGGSRFETPFKPCCMGINRNYSCGSVDENGNKMYTVCNDPRATFFWDMVHPSQAGWRAVYLSMKSTLQRVIL